MPLFAPKNPIAVKQTAIWQALPGSQSLFLSSPVREVCFAGTRGPGKTDAMLMAFAQYCGYGYGDYWRGVIFRRNYKHLDDIIAKSKRWFNRSAQAPRFLAGSSSLKWVWPTGEELLLRAFEDAESYWSYHGHEYPFIGWEELTSWPNIDCYESMKSCNRSSFQGTPALPYLPRLIRSSTNPYGVGHSWVKKYFIDPNPYGKITTDEGGNQRVALFGSVKENPYLGQEYVKTLESITDVNKRKAWLDGSWDITSGGMFDDLWDATKHVVAPFEIPYTWRISRSFDWGSSKPFSVGWWATSDGSDVTLPDGSMVSYPRKTLFRIAEWYGCTGKPNEGLHMTAKTVAQGILIRETQMGIANRVQPGPADSAIYAVTDEASIGQNMEAEGVFWTMADKRPGSRKNGWELIRDRLNSVVKEDDEAGMYIFNLCRDFIRTVPSLARDTRDADDVNCFVAGTLISCPTGQIAVDLLKVGDYVNTPIGPRKVLKAGCSGISKTVKVKLSNGTVLQGTPDHKIYVENLGLLPLCKLQSGHTLTTEAHTAWLKNKFTKGLLHAVTQIKTKVGCANILYSPLQLLCNWEQVLCTGMFGKQKEGQSQKEWMSIIKTTIQQTTILKTWNFYLRQFMQDTICKSDLLKVGISKQLLQIGELATKDKKYLEKILKSVVLTQPGENVRAAIVATLLQHSIHEKLCVTTKIANYLKVAKQKNKNNVLFAALQFLLRVIPQKKCKPVVMHVVGNCEDEKVYYLTVEQAHLFYANNILSTNTDAEDHIADDVRYMVLAADYMAYRVKITGV